MVSRWIIALLIILKIEFFDYQPLWNTDGMITAYKYKLSPNEKPKLSAISSNLSSN